MKSMGAWSSNELQWFKNRAWWAHGLLWWPRTAINNVVVWLIKIWSLFLYCLFEIYKVYYYYCLVIAMATCTIAQFRFGHKVHWNVFSNRKINSQNYSATPAESYNSYTQMWISVCMIIKFSGSDLFWKRKKNSQNFPVDVYKDFLSSFQTCFFIILSIQMLIVIQTLSCTFQSSFLTISRYHCVPCHYNMANLLPNPRNRYPIACLRGWGMGCLLLI